MPEGSCIQFHTSHVAPVLVGEPVFSTTLPNFGVWVIDKAHNNSSGSSSTTITGSSMIYQRAAVFSTKPIEIDASGADTIVQPAMSSATDFATNFATEWRKLQQTRLHSRDCRNISTHQDARSELQRKVLSYLACLEERLGPEEFADLFADGVAKLLCVEPRLAQLMLETLYNHNVPEIDMTVRDTGRYMPLPKPHVRHIVRKVVIRTELRSSATRLLQGLGQRLQGMDRADVTIECSWNVADYHNRLLKAWTNTQPRFDRNPDPTMPYDMPEQADVDKCKQRLIKCLDRLLAIWTTTDGQIDATHLPFTGRPVFVGSLALRCNAAGGFLFDQVDNETIPAPHALGRLPPRPYHY
jgi:hypothetical protein